MLSSFPRIVLKATIIRVIFSYNNHEIDSVSNRICNLVSLSKIPTGSVEIALWHRLLCMMDDYLAG